MNDKSIDINNFGAMVEGVDDIAQSWYNILHTIPGSDPLRMSFGSGIFNYIDKPINQFQGDFAAMVIRDLERWEKRAKITQVERTFEEGKVNVKIAGVFTETNTAISVTIDLSDLQNIDLTELQKAYSKAYQEETYS